MTLLIGSLAMVFHFPDAREVGLDADYICTIDEYHARVKALRNMGAKFNAYPLDGNTMVVKTEYGLIKEFSIAWPGTTNEKILQIENGVASPAMLLLLKLSHRYRKDSPHFLKTMRDIQFLRSKEVSVPKEWLPLLKEREKETYSYAHPKLNQDKKSFFDNSNGMYIYDHDSIHRAVAVEATPAYTKFSEDGQEVKSSRKKWEQCSHMTKLLAGLEESYVLALERSLIPLPAVLTPRQAFDKALGKVCTSITSGWFREFCWENYDNISMLYDESFVDKFNAALERREIKPYGH